MTLKDDLVNETAPARVFTAISSWILAFFLIIYCLQYLVYDRQSANFTNLPPSLLMYVIFGALTVLGVVSMILRKSPARGVNYWLFFGYLVIIVGLTTSTGGVVSPFSVGWFWVILIAYLMFNKAGLVMSILPLTIVIMTSLHSSTSPQDISLINSLILVLTAVLSSLFLVFTQSINSRIKDDLSESQKREDAERSRTVTLINNITDAVLSIDTNGKITLHNSATLDLLDTNENIIGLHIDELIKLEDLEGKKVPTFSELSKSSAIRRRDDIIMKFNDDDSMRLEATIAPIQNSSSSSTKPDSYVLILRDVTRLKSLEEERDEFISVVSHELRTPVAVAEASISNSILLSERGLKAKSKEAIHEAYRQIIFLSKMINDLGTLARAERGVADEPETIDVFEIIEQLHKENVATAKKKGLSLNITTEGKPETVHVSRLYLHELLQNLITNALRYTPKGSVLLSVKTTKSKVTFSVIDTGIGISKPDQKLIFNRFFRAEDYRTRETSGTGLGLYISAKLARKLGSKIELESRLNHGSTFRFSLKLKPNK